MKFIKGLFITLLALVVVYFLFAFFLPNATHVERSVTINSSKSEVWNQINDFEKWQNWSPWMKKDPTIKNTFSGELGAIGSTMSWTSDSSGVGEMKILETISEQSLKASLTFKEPWESYSENLLTLSESNGETTLTWSDHMEIPLIARPIMYFMGINQNKMDEMMGPDFENGLATIKELAESSKPVSKPMEIKEMDFVSATYFGIRHKTTMSEIMKPEFFENNYALISEEIKKNGFTPSGAPVAFYYSWNEEDSTTEIVAAIPLFISSPVAVNGFEFITIPDSKVVKGAYFGAYETGQEGHIQLGAYCEKNGIETELVMEEFANDPKSVSSPSEILTNIYYFIK